jgi:hypothetical protein
MLAQNSAGPFGSSDRLDDCFRALTQEREMALILGRFPSGHQSETLPKSLRLKARLRSILFLLKM